jgi:hypothetical protein
MSSKSTNDFAARLQRLLTQVWTLRPSWEQPEKFHECKSEVVAGLKALIADVGAETSPTIATRAGAALRLREPVELPTAATEPATEPSAASDDVDDASAATDDDAAVPTASSPAELTVADLVRSQQTIRETVAAVSAVLVDVEKLALAAQTAVNAYVTALIVPWSPPALRPLNGAPPATIPAAAAAINPAQLREALPMLPQGQHQFRDLRTDTGRAIAVHLWVTGYRQIDIALHFSGGPGSAPFVSREIGIFVKRMLELRHIIGTDTERKELARQALARFWSQQENPHAGAASAAGAGARPAARL